MMIDRTTFPLVFVVAVLGIAAYTVSAEPTFLENRILSERGFDGAVTVVEYGADEDDTDLGFVTVEIPYRDIEGAPKKGQGRLYIRRDEMESGEPIPPLCHVHYEKNLDGARPWCERGWAVATPHYGDPQQGGYPLELCTGDSNNLSRALIQWVRRLPFVDRTHLHIDGGSAGGYMALAMSADMFPVCATTAIAPVCNWAYNLNYFEVNKPVSGYPLADYKGTEDLRRSPLPIVHVVSGLVAQSMEVFGADLGADAYYLISPIAHLDRISGPVLIQCATGDMLVPMEQMTRDVDDLFDPSFFPANYARDFDTLTLTPKARRRFDELVPEDQVSVQRIPLPEGMHEITLARFLKQEEDPPDPPKIECRWNQNQEWNIVVLEEGSPKPYSPHTRYKWRMSYFEFSETYQEATPSPSILNAAKLDRLLQRYSGELEGLAILAKTGEPMNRLSFQALETLDVVVGLLDYADLGPAHAERLTLLYAEGSRKPFGESVSVDRLEVILSGLRANLVGEPQS